MLLFELFLGEFMCQLQFPLVRLGSKLDFLLQPAGPITLFLLPFRFRLLFVAFAFAFSSWLSLPTSLIATAVAVAA
mgnify:CR=1 FL=1